MKKIITSAVAAAAFISATLLISAAAWLIEPRFFVLSIIVLGTLVSYLTVKRKTRRFFRWLVGASFGFLMGTAYIQALSLASPEWPRLSVKILMSVFFSWIGVVIGTGALNYWPRKKPRAPVSANAGITGSQSQAARPSRLFTMLIGVNLSIIIAITIITVIGLFQGERLELYLTGGLGLAVAAIVSMAADRKYFSWLAFFIAGYLVAAVLLSTNPNYGITEGLFARSLEASGFFAVIGLIIGLAATGVMHIHRALHDFWRGLKR